MATGPFVETPFRLLLLLVLALILGALARGIYFLVLDAGRDRARVVKALTARLLLSFLLFALLLGGRWQGLI